MLDAWMTEWMNEWASNGMKVMEKNKKNYELLHEWVKETWNAYNLWRNQNVIKRWDKQENEAKKN